MSFGTQTKKVVIAQIFTDPKVRVQCKLTQFHSPRTVRGPRVRFSGLFARWRFCERNFNYQSDLRRRAAYVGLCPIFLVVVVVLLLLLLLLLLDFQVALMN